MQIFTKNQRQWKVKPLTEEAVQTWFQHQKETGITDVVTHDSYLINLASPKPEAREKSINLFLEELTRCETLGIPTLVTHPGAHMGEGEAAGLKRVATAFDEIHKQLPGLKVRTALEVTEGQGTCLGHRFEHLATIIDLVKDPDRLVICLDTAHMIAAGYDLTSGNGAKSVLQQLDDIVGLDRVQAVHMNDSKVPRGKRVDRHEHIGHGFVSLDAFKVIVNEPKFRNIPKILETAKEDNDQGVPWDTINLATLQGLVKKKSKKASSQKANSRTSKPTKKLKRK